MSKPAQLPTTRVNTIMKSCSDVETVTKESTLVMCKAAELFIKALAKESYSQAKVPKKLDYKDLAEVVQTEDRYDFLREIMPRKITVAEFKKLLAKKKKAEGASASENSSSEESDSSSGSEEENDE